MDHPAPRSLRHEYDLFVENELENYKDSISRAVLLKIADEAVTSLHSQPQFAMSELLITEEVDKLIRKRIRIPTYVTWRRRELKKLKELEELRRPEHWGLASDGALAREIHLSPYSRVLVAGADVANAALYLAAHGCAVTTIQPESQLVDSVRTAAEAAQLPGKIDTHPSPISEWISEDGPLNAVVCTPAAFAGLTPVERSRVLAVLQSATSDGGVHLVETIIAGHSVVSVAELRKSYKGWQVSIVEDGSLGKSFVARKAVA